MSVEKHELPSALTPRPARLPEELGMYVDALTKKHDGVAQVWLLGAPRRGDLHPKWELLLFADERRLEALRADAAAHRDDVELIVVVDGDRFESAWGARHGRLGELGWRLDGAQAASYRRAARGPDVAVEVAIAHRVR